MDHWFEILSIRVRYPPIQQGIVTIYAKACKKKKKKIWTGHVLDYQPHVLAMSVSIVSFVYGIILSIEYYDREPRLGRTLRS